MKKILIFGLVCLSVMQCKKALSLDGKLCFEFEKASDASSYADSAAKIYNKVERVDECPKTRVIGVCDAKSDTTTPKKGYFYSTFGGGDIEAKSVCEMMVRGKWIPQ